MGLILPRRSGLQRLQRRVPFMSGGVAGAAAGLPARTTPPTLNAGYHYFPSTSADRYLAQSNGAPSTQANGDTCVVFTHQYNLTGGNMSTTVNGAIIEGSDDNIGTTIYEGTIHGDAIATNATFTGHFAVGSYVALSDDAFFHMNSTDNPNTIVAFATSYLASTVDGSPSVVDSGLINGGSGFEIASNGLFTFPEHEIPTGYTFLYLIMKQDNVGTSPTWNDGLTDTGTYNNALGYDTYSWSAYKNGEELAFVPTVNIGSNAYTDIEAADGYGWGCILAIPGV